MATTRWQHLGKPRAKDCVGLRVRLSRDVLLSGGRVVKAGEKFYILHTYRGKFTIGTRTRRRRDHGLGFVVSTVYAAMQVHPWALELC